MPNDILGSKLRIGVLMSKCKKNPKKNIRIYEKSRRHFRAHIGNVRGKIIWHPAYVVGEGDNVYASFGITHKKKKGKGHSNHRLLTNPQIGKRGESRIKRDMEVEHRGMYSKCPLRGFRMSEKDDEYVDGRILKALASNPNLIPPPDVRKLKPLKPPEKGASRPSRSD